MGAGCSGDYGLDGDNPRHVSRSSRDVSNLNLPSHGVGSINSAAGNTGPVRATPLAGKKYAVGGTGNNALPSNNSNRGTGSLSPAFDKPVATNNSSRPDSAGRIRRAGSGVRLDPLQASTTAKNASAANSASTVASAQQLQQVPSAISTVVEPHTPMQTTQHSNKSTARGDNSYEAASGRVTPATATKNGQLQPLQRTHSQSQHHLTNNNRASAQVDAHLAPAPRAALAASSRTSSSSVTATAPVDVRSGYAPLQQPPYKPNPVPLPAGLPSILATAADPYAAVAQMHAAQQAQQQQLQIQQLQLHQQQLQLQQLMQQQQQALYGSKHSHNRNASAPNDLMLMPSLGQPQPHHPSLMQFKPTSVQQQQQQPLGSSRSNSQLHPVGGVGVPQQQQQQPRLSVDANGGGMAAPEFGARPSPAHYLSPMSVPQGSHNTSLAFASRSMTPTSSVNGPPHHPHVAHEGSTGAQAAMIMHMQIQMQKAAAAANAANQAAGSNTNPTPNPSNVILHSAQIQKHPTIITTRSAGSLAGTGTPTSAAVAGGPPGAPGASAIAVSTAMIYHDANPEYESYKRLWALENEREVALKRERQAGRAHGRKFSRSLLTTPDRSAAASPTFAASPPHNGQGQGQRFFPGNGNGGGATSPLSPGSPPHFLGGVGALVLASPTAPDDGSAGGGALDIDEPLSPFDIENAEGDMVIGSGYLVGERTALGLLVETRSPQGSMCPVSPVPGFRVMSVSPTPFELQPSPMAAAAAGAGPPPSAPRARFRVAGGTGALSPTSGGTGGALSPALMLSPRTLSDKMISGSPLVLGLGVASVPPGGSPPKPGGQGPGPGGGGGGGGGGGAVAGPPATLNSTPLSAMHHPPVLSTPVSSGGGTISIDEQLQARQARLIQQQITLQLQQQQQQLHNMQQQHAYLMHAASRTPTNGGPGTGNANLGVAPIAAPALQQQPQPQHPRSSTPESNHYQQAQLQLLQQQLVQQLSATQAHSSRLRQQQQQQQQQQYPLQQQPFQQHPHHAPHPSFAYPNAAAAAAVVGPPVATSATAAERSRPATARTARTHAQAHVSAADASSMHPQPLQYPPPPPQQPPPQPQPQMVPV